MRKAIKKVVALLLTVVMLLSLSLPMVGAVEATTVTYPTYAEAEDGDLLYKVDFNDKSRFDYQVQGNVTATLTPSTDGRSLAISGQSGNQFTVGGEIKYLPLEGAVYTLDFSVTLNNRGATTYVALAPNAGDVKGTYSFNIRPDTGRVEIEQNPTPTFSNAGFTSNYFMLKEETVAEGVKLYYRLVINRDAETVDFYYLNQQDVWICALTGNGFAPEVENLSLYICSYFEDPTVISDVSIYKGAISTPSNPSDKEECDDPLIYEVDFNDKSKFNYSAQGDITGNITPSTDGTALTIKGKSGNQFTIGGEIDGLPMDDNAVYTVDFNITMHGGWHTHYICLAPDLETGKKGNYGFLIRTNFVQIENTFANAIGQPKANFISPATEQTSEGTKMNFRLRINSKTDVVDFYYLNTSGSWIYALSGTGFAPSIENLSLYFSVYNPNEDAVLSDIKIYSASNFVKIIDGEESKTVTIPDSTEYILPNATKAGYMFKGWKLNGSETITRSGTVISAAELETIETVFVPIMSEVFWQSKANEDETYDVRFVSAIDSLKYSEIGYNVTIKYGNKQIDNNGFKLTYVYESLSASYGTEKVTLDTLGYSNDDGYIVAFVIKNIPDSISDITVELTPYYVKPNETTVNMGEKITFTIATSDLNG